MATEAVGPATAATGPAAVEGKALATVPGWTALVGHLVAAAAAVELALATESPAMAALSAMAGDREGRRVPLVE